MKEFIISIGIIAFIFILDFATQKYTKETVDIMSTHLHELRNEIKGDDQEKLEESIKKINDDWNKYNKTLSLYIEHDELEKVETYLSGFESYIDEEDEAVALNEIDKTEFVLEHISNKYKFNMENIF